MSRETRTASQTFELEVWPHVKHRAADLPIPGLEG
jgi:hypothetical protein